MSTLDAVAEVLREIAPRALNARQIVELAKGRLPTASRTPETVVSRDLAIEVKRNGAKSRFLRAAPGEFLLKEALPTAFFNDVDPYASQWTRNLIEAGELAAGVVDERSIRDLKPADVASYRQCHFFSGVGVWSRTLRDAGWPDDINVWSGSCPCFPAGTLVLTQRGNIAIEDVQVGDIVLTHQARWRRVQAVGSEFGRCVQLKGQGHWGLACTPEHPFLSGEEEWTQASQMAGKRWATVANVPSFMEIPPLETKTGAYYDAFSKGFRAKGERAGKSIYLGLYRTKEEAQHARDAAVREGRIDVKGANAVNTASLEFARFLGYWVGDGWTTGDFVCVCGAKEDGDFLKRLMESAGLSSSASLERTSSRARCGSKSLVAWLKLHFGQGAANKRIPAWLHGASAEYRQAFLSGYFAADGHRERRRSGASVLVFTTVSRALAIGTRILLNQAGISASIGRTHARGGKTIIEGRVVREHPMFRVSAYDKARSFDFCGPHGRGLVRTVTAVGESRVYNLAVEEDESYCADGIVVHNCQPLSQAGRRLGFADERHLWPEWFRLIDACRPSVVIGEQTASALGRAWLDLVFADLEGAGYTCRAFDLPACCVGAPHRRQRLYFVAHARERGREILSAPWLHAHGQSRHDVIGCSTADGGDAITVSDAAGARRSESEDPGADRGDAIACTEAIDRRTTGHFELERSGPDDGTSAVSDAERVVWDERRIGGSHGRPEVEPDRHGETDGASVVGSGSVELGHAGLARGRRYAGEVSRAEGAGEGERIEVGNLAHESVASGADDSSAFRPGDRIRIDGDPGWGGAVRGYWVQDVEWIYCRPEPGHKDGRWRPAKSGHEPLVNGTAAGVGRTRAKRLRCFGNAIVLPLATTFVSAVIDAFVDAAQIVDGQAVQASCTDEPPIQSNWTGPHPNELAPSGMLLGRVPGERWPYGPPSAHESGCRLFPYKGNPGGLFCDCAASAADDVEHGVGT